MVDNKVSEMVAFIENNNKYDNNYLIIIVILMKYH